MEAKRIGRIVYIEPNEIPLNSSNIKLLGNDGKNITWNPEDLNMSVDLQVFINDRWGYVQAKNGINITGDGLSSSLFTGSLTGSQRNLTTDYINVGFSEIANEEISNTENIGVDSIDIQFDSHFYPIVNIHFTDVRASSLFMPAEMEYTNSLKNSYNEKVKNDPTKDKFNIKPYTNLFKSFFQFPYPKFLLTIKGFYGNKVTFMLSVYEFKSQFNSNTGNFDVDVSFIGYMYGVYTDIPFSFIMAAPYLDNQEYWNSRSFTLPDGSPMKTFKDINQAITEMKSPDSEDTENSGKVIKLKKEVENLNTIIKYYNEFIDSIRFTDRLNRAKIEDENKIYLYIEELSDKEIRASFDKDKYKLLQELINSFNNTSDISDTIANIKIIENKINNDTVAESNQIILINNSLIQENIFRNINVKENYSIHYVEINKSFIKEVYTLINNIKDKINVHINKQREYNDLTIKNFGFKPTLENIMQTLFAHIECFMHEMDKTLSSISSKEGIYSRNTDVCGVNFSETDVKTSSNTYLPPFFELYKDSKRIYIGEDRRTSSFSETELIKKLINACEYNSGESNKINHLNFTDTSEEKPLFLNDLKWILRSKNNNGTLFSAYNIGKQITGGNNNPAYDNLCKYISARSHMLINEFRLNKKYDYNLSYNIKDIDFTNDTFLFQEFVNFKKEVIENFDNSLLSYLSTIKKEKFEEDCKSHAIDNGYITNTNPKRTKNILNEIDEILSVCEDNTYCLFEYDGSKKILCDNFINVSLSEYNPKFYHTISDKYTNYGTIRPFVKYSSENDTWEKIKNFFKVANDSTLTLGKDGNGIYCLPIGDIECNEKLSDNNNIIFTGAPVVVGKKSSEKKNYDIFCLCRYKSEAGIIELFRQNGNNANYNNVVATFYLLASLTANFLKNYKKTDVLILPRAIILYFGALLYRFRMLRNNETDIFGGNGNFDWTGIYTTYNNYASDDMNNPGRIVFLGGIYENYDYDYSNYTNPFHFIMNLVYGTEIMSDQSVFNIKNYEKDRFEHMSLFEQSFNNFLDEEQGFNGLLDSYKLDTPNNDYGEEYQIADNNGIFVKKIKNLFDTKYILYNISNEYILDDTNKDGIDNKKLIEELISRYVREVNIQLTEHKEEVTVNNVTLDKINENNKIKLALYDNLKNLHDKWLTSYEDINVWSLEKEKNEYKNFLFVDSFFKNIGSDYLINLNKLQLLLKSASTLSTNNGMSLYQFMAQFAQDNKLLFIALPIHNKIYDIDSLKSIFTPNSLYNYNDKNNTEGYGNTYVMMYTHELSKTLSDESIAYRDDGIDLSNTLGIIPKEFCDEGETVAAFGVTYGMQNQNYFIDISINMDNPQVTDYSILNQLQIAASEQDGEKNSGVLISNDLYSIYSNRSYTCSVKMLGCMDIMPMMYFQLNNIPMFKGLYMIISVKHSITAGKMFTTFTGVRMSKYKQELISVDEMLLLSSPLDRSGFESVINNSYEKIDESVKNYVAYNTALKTKHFNISSFEVGENNKVPKKYEERVKSFIINILDPLYEAWYSESGVGFYINSGYRSPEKNKEIGGSNTSAHCYAYAVDLISKTINNLTPMESNDAFREFTCKWLQKNKIAFDQFIDERTPTSQTGWLHIGLCTNYGTQRREYSYARINSKGKYDYNPLKDIHEEWFV